MQEGVKMAEQKKETLYQVKGADGMYHSVPQSRLQEFNRQQEELRKQGMDEAYWEKQTEDRWAKALAESTPEELEWLQGGTEDSETER